MSFFKTKSKKSFPHNLKKTVWMIKLWTWIKLKAIPQSVSTFHINISFQHSTVRFPWIQIRLPSQWMNSSEIREQESISIMGDYTVTSSYYTDRKPWSHELWRVSKAEHCHMLHFDMWILYHLTGSVMKYNITSGYAASARLNSRFATVPLHISQNWVTVASRLWLRNSRFATLTLHIYQTG